LFVESAVQQLNSSILSLDAAVQQADSCALFVESAVQQLNSSILSLDAAVQQADSRA